MNRQQSLLIALSMRRYTFKGRTALLGAHAELVRIRCGRGIQSANRVRDDHNFGRVLSCSVLKVHR